MTAPATMLGFMLKALPIPIIATPTVAMVDQELPVATETILHIITEAIRKKEGDMSLIP
ncbi:hypothetical protein GCM10007042_00450 [Butyricimonas paravirosa]|nr:hypothetical protein GCM10007042_00450 [Butyricimonas paravirosa]